VEAAKGLRPLDESANVSFRDGRQDLVLETDVTIHPLLTGELSTTAAIESGRVEVTGNRKLFERFVDVFHIPPVPVARHT
jgi:hypothetical protein